MQGIGLTYSFTSDPDEFRKAEGPKINYSSEDFENAFTVRPHPVLVEYGIKDYLIEVNSSEQYFKFFFKTSKGDVPFDVFGASFWLISRYEEYLPFKANRYNAFDYRGSLAWQNSFLDMPLVNIWMEAVKKQLKAKFPVLQFKEKDFKAVTTIDIDSVFKYKHKGLVRSLFGIIADLRAGNFSAVKDRLNTVFFGRHDEFDCYDFLVNTNKTFNTEAIYFFLLGDYGDNDKNHPASNLKFQALIKHLADYSKTGIHPSFASNSNLQQLKIEIARLTSINHKEVAHSRQHFGILKFPYTYKSLLQSGIRHDYSLGYTNINGFRAGICQPFKWYDLEEETETALMLHPFCITDVTLNRETSKTSQNPLEIYKQYLNTVKLHHGEMVTVFHNDMLSNTAEGKKWQNNYLKFQEILFNKG